MNEVFVPTYQTHCWV